MNKIVLDTNCLLMSIPKKSPYHTVWSAFVEGTITLCVTTDILEEYFEILSQKIGGRLANNILETIVNKRNVKFVSPTYKFNLIEADKDDNKFVDCAIVAGATCIVSNDNHFKILKEIPFPKVSVYNILEFTRLLKSTLN